MQELSFSLVFHGADDFEQFCHQATDCTLNTLIKFERDRSEFTLHFRSALQAYKFGYDWGFYQQESIQRRKTIAGEIAEAQENYDWGLITSKEYEARLLEIRANSVKK